MAVYEMNRRAIADYLSDTKNMFTFDCSLSNEGGRIGKRGGNYPIRVAGLLGQEVVPKVDCFLNEDESISVRVYLPKYTYVALTKELHKAYSPDERLRFTFYADARTFEYTLPKKPVTSYKDFKGAMDDLIQRISKEMEKDINCFCSEDEWNFVGINLNVIFKVASMSTK